MRCFDNFLSSIRDDDEYMRYVYAKYCFRDLLTVVSMIPIFLFLFVCHREPQYFLKIINVFLQLIHWTF